MSWDKRTLGHKKPCPDCPFRVNALPSYLGGWPLETYAQPPSIGMPTSCHRFDKGAEDVRTKFCAGSLATIANDPDVVPLDDYAEAVAAVGPRDDCLPTAAAFRELHKHADRFVV